MSYKHKYHLPSLNRQIVIISSLILLLMVSGGGWSWWVTKRQNHDLDWTQRRYVSLDALVAINQHVLRAESEVRGYIITSDSLFNLNPYLLQIDQQLERLLVSLDDPMQQQRGRTLQQLLERRADVFRTTTSLQRGGKDSGIHNARIYQSLHNGRKLSTTIVQLIDVIKQEEQTILSVRRVSTERSLQHFRQMLILGAVLATSLSLYAIWLVSNEMRRRTHLESSLRATSHQKDRFFSIIGHDLKAPFNSILGLTRLMMNTSARMSEAELTQMTQLINESAQRTSRLLQNLLEWARIQMDHGEANLETVPLHKVVQEEIENLGLVAQQKQIQLLSQVSHEVCVQADVHMLATVVRNLLSNAIKFSFPDATVFVQARRSGHFWEVSVRDEGTGILPEIKSRLFQIDQHVTMRGTRNEQGTGLGLILCKEMVERQGGTLRVESLLNQGTTFYFTLRALTLPAAAPPPLQPAPGKRVNVPESRHA